MNIFLIGFMGSGKTTIGKMLSRSLKMPFVDLDQMIEQSESQTISEIFVQAGESEFRKKESKYLQEICRKHDQIISVGGGAPCFFENMELMNKHGRTVYLKMGTDAILERFMTLTPSARQSRPLLANKTKEELYEFISLTLQKREPFYEKASIIVFNEGTDSSKTVERIMMAL